MKKYSVVIYGRIVDDRCVAQFDDLNEAKRYIQNKTKDLLKVDYNQVGDNELVDYIQYCILDNSTGTKDKSEWDSNYDDTCKEVYASEDFYDD